MKDWREAEGQGSWRAVEGMGELEGRVENGSLRGG